MNNQDIAKHSAAMLDLFEAEQQRILLLDPKERAMQHNYQKTMAVCYELRTFIRSIDAKPSAVLEAAPASSASAQAVDAILSQLTADEGAAHMYPSDLERFQTGEHTGGAFSIAVGCPNEESIPLFTMSQILTALRQSQQSPVQASDAANDAARRYEIVRKLNVPQFQAIYIENAKHGVPFDDLVDQFGKRASDAGRQG